MAFSFNLITLLLFLCHAQALAVLMIMIVEKIRKRDTFVYLHLLYFFTVYSNLSDLIIPTGIYKTLSFLIFTDFPVRYLIPPLIYLSLKEMLSGTEAQEFRNRKSLCFLHFIPFFLLIIPMLPVFSTSGTSRITMIELGPFPNMHKLGLFLSAIGFVQYISYLLLSSIYIKRHKKINNERVASRVYGEGMVFIFLYTILFFCKGLSFIESDFLNLHNNLSYSSGGLLLDITLVLFFILGYYIISASKWSGRTLSYKTNTKKYQHSGLSEEEINHNFQKIEQLIQKEKLWIDPDFTPRTIEDKLGLSPYHISQVINQSCSVNFNTYINRFRIKEACRKLKESDRTVLDIAYESGFNSKAAFYKNFKLETCLTPGEFRNKMQKK